jgi:hypothetical protein
MCCICMVFLPFGRLFYDLCLILVICKVFLRTWLVPGREKPQIRPISILDITTLTYEYLVSVVSPGTVGILVIFSVPSTHSMWSSDPWTLSPPIQYNTIEILTTTHASSGCGRGPATVLSLLLILTGRRGYIRFFFGDAVSQAEEKSTI